jgi:hypothetical protein
MRFLISQLRDLSGRRSGSLLPSLTSFASAFNLSSSSFTYSFASIATLTPIDPDGIEPYQSKNGEY